MSPWLAVLALCTSRRANIQNLHRLRSSIAAPVAEAMADRGHYGHDDGARNDDLRNQKFEEFSLVILGALGTSGVIRPSA